VLSYGVNLHQAIEAVHATVEMATRQGLSQARIALEPAELGAIRIHLTQTAQGLIARVSADTPAAAQALAEGRSELRQSLSSLGLTALHLNSPSSDQAGMQQQHDPASRGHDLFAPSPNPSRSAEHESDEDRDTGAGDALSDPASPAPGSTRGALVDVLA
jgi:flagellar hook-length control protein FliK